MSEDSFPILLFLLLIILLVITLGLSVSEHSIRCAYVLKIKGGYKIKLDVIAATDPTIRVFSNAEEAKSVCVQLNELMGTIDGENKSGLYQRLSQ